MVYEETLRTVNNGQSASKLPTSKKEISLRKEFKEEGSETIISQS